MYARDPSNKDGLAVSYDFDPANVVKTSKGQVSLDSELACQALLYASQWEAYSKEEAAATCHPAYGVMGYDASDVVWLLAPP